MRRNPNFAVTPERNTPLDPACLPQYWYPQRFGVQYAPDDFRTQLRRINADLDCTWTPVDHRWLIWQRDPTVQHHLCPRWSLKIVWQGHQDRFLPLDERVFANIYARQVKRYEGEGKGYFERIVSEMDRDKAIAVKDSKADASARRRELFRSRQITNIGRGNKFALHHDGTIIPSRGELDWQRELWKSGRPS